MPTVDVYNIEGAKVGQLELSEDVFGIEPNEPVMHQAVTAYLANQRQGTHSTKTRGEVSGGGRKPWRQKGTGRARQGSITAPQWTGGGIVFGPKPRSYRMALPKKVRRLAIKSALSAKVRNGEIIVVDQLTMAEPKTKEMVRILNNLDAGKKTLVVTGGLDRNVYLSGRNIPGVSVSLADWLNVYQILAHHKVVMTQDAVRRVEEVFA
ncbi:MAG: 50S ribosomal protein L4 [Firmicutes bacterium]|nr:50S ribosomal protein L4 [Bacillota bacterium]